MDILSKILNHEDEIHNRYLTKRTKLLEHIKQIEINNLNKDQLLIFINDLKAILDPIKTSIGSMEHLLSNKFFKKEDSLQDHSYLLFFLILKTFFFVGSSDSDESIELNSDSV